MSPEKWRGFGVAFIVFVVVASLMIFEQGGFDGIGFVGLGILLLAAAAVGASLYFFVKDEPGGPDFH